MQRVGFAGVSALFCIVLSLLSCDIDGMSADIRVANPENEGLQYLTVTYHSDLHTSGEVPVDPTRYPVPRMNFNVVPPMTVVHAEPAVILDQGTLEKEGYVFWGWVTRNADGHSQAVSCNMNGHMFPAPPGTVLHSIRENLDLHAIWRSESLGQ